MKNIVLWLVCLSCLALTFSSFATRPAGTPAPFYYAYARKIPLKVAPNQFVVRYSTTPGLPQGSDLLKKLTAAAHLRWLNAKTAIVTTNAEGMLGSGTLLDRLGAVTINPLYLTPDGSEAAVTEEIAVKYLATATSRQIAALAERTGSRVKWTAGAGLLVLAVPKGGDALAVANSYQESGLVEFAHPNFILEIAKHQVIPNDEYFSRQFYLRNTGQVIADGHTGTPGADIRATVAWGLTQGNSNITVAILDDGVSANHPDLPTSRQVRLPGSNFSGEGNINDPSPMGFSAHGNHCAGIIAATLGNNEGIAGIAPNCKVMPIRIFDAAGGTQGTASLAAAISFAKNNGADVISNSWGADAERNPNAIPAIVNAIQDATSTGRNNRGCVVAFSSGNNANHATGSNGWVGFPSNVAIPGVLTVGASDRDDRQATYSGTSSRNSSQNQIIDVVAPSHRAYPTQITGETFEVWTTDTEQAGGETGDNPWPNLPNKPIPPQLGEHLPNAGTNFLFYTARFGGTSAACPQVAGIAALILSVNPNFSQQQVFDIITSSADKVGPYNYEFSGASNELGFGRVNACRSVQRAINFSAQVVNPQGNSFCGSSTFSLQGLTNAATSVTWSTSDTGFAVIDANGNATATGTGPVTITATALFPNGCGTVVYSLAVQAINPNVTGRYLVPATSTEGTLVPSSYDANYVDDTHVSVVVPYQSATYEPASYSFSLQQPSSWQLYQDPNYPRMFQLYKISQLTSSDGAYVDITKTTTCGTVTQNFVFVYTPSYDYSISPNPAGEELSVQARSTASRAHFAAVDEPVFVAELYDWFGRRIKMQKSTYGTSVLDIHALPNGVYTLRIGQGRKAFSRQVQVLH